MTKKLTREQMDVLAKYEDNLRHAYKADWVSAMTTKAISEINDVMMECGINLGVNPNCSACVLQLCKVAGGMYFQQLEEWIAKADKQTEDEIKAERMPRKAPTRRKRPENVK